MPTKVTKVSWRAGGDATRPGPAPPPLPSSSSDAPTSGGVAFTTFVLAHPTHQLSRKLVFTSPPPWASLIEQVLRLLAPSPFVAEQLGLSFFDSQRRRHLVDGEPGLLELYNAVADDEEIRLRVVVREGGPSMGLKEIDEALRQMFLRKDIIDEPIPVFAHEPLQRRPRTRGSTSSSSRFASSGSPITPFASLTSPPQLVGSLGSSPGLWPALSSAATLARDDFDFPMPASPPASIASFAPSLPDSISEDGEPCSRWNTWEKHQPSSWTVDDEGEGEDWSRAESVVKSIRRLIEDFPAPLQPKHKASQPAQPATAVSPDDIVDGLRCLVEELRASMQRMDAIRARTIDLIGDTLFAPSCTPSPIHSPPKPLAPLLSPAPVLHHPVPEHLIPRPTYDSSSTVSATVNEQPLPEFAPARKTLPQVASPDAGSTAFLPKGLDLDFESSGPSPVADVPLSRSMPSALILGPQRSVETERSKMRTPTAAAALTPIPPAPVLRAPTPPPLSLDEFPPLSMAATANKKVSSRFREIISTEGSFSSSSTAPPTSNGSSERSSGASSPPTSASPATPVATPSAKLAAVSLKAPAFIAPASNQSGLSHRPSPSLGGLTPGQRNQLMATATPFVSQQQYTHQQPFGQPLHQQVQPFFSPSHNQWLFPQAPNNNGQAFVFLPQTMQPHGRTSAFGGQQRNPYLGNGYEGWPGGMPGFIPNGFVPGYGFSLAGYHSFSPSPPQPWLQVQRAHEQQTIHYGGSWRPHQPMSTGTTAQYSTPTSSTPRLSPGGQGEQPATQPPTSQRTFPAFPTKTSSQTTAGTSAPVPTLASASEPSSTPASSLFQLPPPPLPGATSPPPMPAHLLPAYLRLYANAFPADAAVRIQLADQQLAAMLKAGRDTAQIIPSDNKAGWIDTLSDPAKGGAVAGAP